MPYHLLLRDAYAEFNLILHEGVYQHLGPHSMGGGTRESIAKLIHYGISSLPIGHQGSDHAIGYRPWDGSAGCKMAQLMEWMKLVEYIITISP